jgi:uncharacterized LabA/DUF88 family protein
VRLPARAAHLVDADNLIGDPNSTDAARISDVFRRYRELAHHAPGDHTVVATGCNGLHVLTTELAWPGVCHRRRAGRDGADLALLEEATWIADSGRFQRVVIGSGDHALGDAVDLLVAAGLDVEVITRRRSAAAELLRRARWHVHYLDLPPVAVVT